jgi:cell division protein FtsB
MRAGIAIVGIAALLALCAVMDARSEMRDECDTLRDEAHALRQEVRQLRADFEAAEWRNHWNPE